MTVNEPGLMPVGPIYEAPAVLRGAAVPALVRFPAANIGPSGKHLRKRRDVRFAVAATTADRMQFQNFAREIFVKAGAPFFPTVEFGPIELSLSR